MNILTSFLKKISYCFLVTSFILNTNTSAFAGQLSAKDKDTSILTVDNSDVNTIGMKKTSDSGYIVYGNVDIELRRPLLTKLDSNLNVEWSKAYDGTPSSNQNDYGTFNDIEEIILPGGERAYLGIGENYDGGPLPAHAFAPWAAIIYNGNIITDFSFDTLVRLKSLAVDKENGHRYIAGSKEFTLSGGMAHDFDPIFLKYELGNLIWSKKIHIAGITDPLYLRSIDVVALDGGQGAFFSIDSFGGSSSLFVGKIKPDGTLAWFKRVANNGGSPTDLSEIKRALDGGFIVYSQRNLIKFRPDGNIDWHKRVEQPTTGYIDIADILVESDGTYKVLVSAEEKIVMQKLNRNGTVVWDRTYFNNHTDPGYSLTAIDVLQSNNGYVVSVDNVAEAGSGALNQTALIQTDAHGYSESCVKSFNNVLLADYNVSYTVDFDTVTLDDFVLTETYPEIETLDANVTKVNQCL